MDRQHLGSLQEQAWRTITERRVIKPGDVGSVSALISIHPLKAFSECMLAAPLIPIEGWVAARLIHPRPEGTPALGLLALHLSCFMFLPDLSHLYWLP